MILTKLKKEMKEEAFKDIYVWEDKPGKLYEPHSHKWETKLVIIAGSIKIKTTGKWKTLKAGDSIYIKYNQIHEAVVGNRGCKYLVGEGKIK